MLYIELFIFLYIFHQFLYIKVIKIKLFMLFNHFRKSLKAADFILFRGGYKTYN